MKKLYLFIGLMVFMGSSVWAQGDEDSEMFNRAKKRDQQAVDEALNGWWTASMKNVDQRLAWWREARFGMFVHWGIYSLPAGEWKGKPVNGYAEHLMRKEKITRAEYLDLAHQFNPVKFNADEWILAAKNAGMRYFVITAKHHDGFAMYPSVISDFNIHEQTPFKRDPMAELAAACKKYGVKFGFYYSHAFDWEHPDAPGNDWEYKNPGGDLGLFGGANWFDAHPELLPKAVKYVDEKAIPQIKELLTKYHPDILWFDTPGKLPLSENIRILKAIRETDPNVVVNGRLARSPQAMMGDYKNTADRPAEFFPVTGDWEAIPTTNESYGYHKFDKSHKSAAFFIKLMANAASRGGNLLMNIGPMGNGQMDPKDLEILTGIGKWMDKNSESIYGTTKSPLALQSWGVVTRKGEKLFLQVFNWPSNGSLVVGGLKSKVKKAYLLTDAAQKLLTVKRVNPLDISIALPSKAPDAVSSVVVLEMQGAIVADTVRLLSGSSVNRLLAFDANLQGKGFKYGDGKTNKYFVENWKSKDQKVNWTVRFSAPVTYKVSLKYASSPEGEGTVKFLSDKKVVKTVPVQSKTKAGDVVTVDLGTFSLSAGSHELCLEPAEIKKSELMKLIEIELVPLTK
ncbi:MAG: alpha-L-fucosidase [Bacteroidota bacterium]|nr:alpha-L-fucosidase [Bacteroidota bacterium]